MGPQLDVRIASELRSELREELRVELREAVQKEAAAVAALDEQLWIVSKQQSELTRAWHLRERVVGGGSRLLASARGGTEDMRDELLELRSELVAENDINCSGKGWALERKFHVRHDRHNCHRHHDRDTVGSKTDSNQANNRPNKDGGALAMARLAGEAF